MKKLKAFTLIELIIVIGLISIMATLGFSMFYNAQKNSRDAKRKADLDTIRASLELFRTNNSYYPLPSDLDSKIPIELTEGEIKYLQSLPEDPYSSKPETSKHVYQYQTIPFDCTELCNDYKLGALLEKSTVSNCEGNITCGKAECNYCVGPNGKL